LIESWRTTDQPRGGPRDDALRSETKARCEASRSTEIATAVRRSTSSTGSVTSEGVEVRVEERRLPPRRGDHRQLLGLGELGAQRLVEGALAVASAGHAQQTQHREDADDQPHVFR
jgi:hypothetical protein